MGANFLLLGGARKSSDNPAYSSYAYKLLSTLDEVCYWSFVKKDLT